jgi:hypothetical protein
MSIAFHNKTVWLSETVDAQIQEPRPLVGSTYKPAPEVASVDSAFGMPSGAKIRNAKIKRNLILPMPQLRQYEHHRDKPAVLSKQESDFNYLIINA